MANVEDKEIHRGDNIDYDFTVTDNDKDLVDLTGATLWFTVKENFDETDANAEFQLCSDTPSEIEILDQVSNLGKAEIHISSTDTDGLQVKTYYYDVQIKTSAGKVYTISEGEFIVKPDVTRSTS